MTIDLKRYLWPWPLLKEAETHLQKVRQQRDRAYRTIARLETDGEILREERDTFLAELKRIGLRRDAKGRLQKAAW